MKVIPAALGINTYAGEVGVATDATSGALLSFTNSGTPGEIITLWATGLGADPADSDTTLIASPHAVNTPLQIYIGNDPATILYQGASPYPGVNQINVVIPSTALTGCFVPLVAIAGGVMGNNVFLPIANGGGACFDSVSGLNGNQMPVGGTQTLNTGFMTILQVPDGKGGVTNTTDGSFQRYVGTFPANRSTPGTCIVNQPVPAPTFSGLDAGKITLTGPNGLNINVPNQLGIKGAFYSMLTSTAIPPAGGTFTFSGSGGADVGPFTGNVTISTPLISMTNANALTTIDRSLGFEVDWTGGNPGSLVYISGDVGTGQNAIGFTCTENVAAGKLQVPAFLLSVLPAGKGSIGLQNSWFVPVTATGLDFGSVGADISVPTVTATFN